MAALSRPSRWRASASARAPPAAAARARSAWRGSRSCTRSTPAARRSGSRCRSLRPHWASAPVPDAVAVVGAGITGLACAEALRGHAHVTIVDRVPVAGGVHGWEAAETVDLAGRCGARMLLGETAVRWDGAELLIIGQDGPRRLAAAALVIATGTRPLGRAELG